MQGLFGGAEALRCTEVWLCEYVRAWSMKMLAASMQPLSCAIGLFSLSSITGWFPMSRDCLRHLSSDSSASQGLTGIECLWRRGVCRYEFGTIRLQNIGCRQNKSPPDEGQRMAVPQFIMTSRLHLLGTRCSSIAAEQQT